MSEEARTIEPEQQMGAHCRVCKRRVRGLRALHDRTTCSSRCSSALDCRGAIRRLVDEFSDLCGLKVDVLLFGQSKIAANARRELFWRCRQLDPLPSFTEIAETLGFSVDTVYRGWKRHMGLESAKPEKVCPDCSRKVRADGFCSARCAQGGES